MLKNHPSFTHYKSSMRSSRHVQVCVNEMINSRHIYLFIYLYLKPLYTEYYILSIKIFHLFV